jgi:hypothetical protein
MEWVLGASAGPACHIGIRFVEGKVADGQVFVSDPAQLDAFWS